MSLQSADLINRSNFTTKRFRVNEQIKANLVRVIDIDNTQYGVYQLRDALRLAKEKNLDLVEMNQEGNTVIAKLMDYGKYKYKLEKLARKSKKSVVELKEVRFRPNIGDYDLETKVQQIRKFLEKRCKVKISMVFRGREVTHAELGQSVLDNVMIKIQDLAKTEKVTKLEGKIMSVLVVAK